MTPLEAHYSRRKLAVGLAGGAIYAGLSIFLMMRADLGVAVFGALLFAFSLWPIWLCPRAMRVRDVIVRIGPEGIFDRRVLDRTVPWHAVANVEELRSVLVSIFLFTLNEPLEHFAASRRRRWRMKMVTVRYGGHVFIASGDLDASTAQIRDALRTHWKNWA